MFSFRALRQIAPVIDFDYWCLFVLSGKSYVMFHVLTVSLRINIVMSQFFTINFK